MVDDMDIGRRWVLLCEFFVVGAHVGMYEKKITYDN